MSEADDVLLTQALEALTFSREGTIAEAANIPAEKWDFRPHPEVKTVAELVRHMIEAGVMMVGEAADPDGDYQRRSPEEHVKAHLGGLKLDDDPVTLQAALRTTLDNATRAVREAGPDFMRTPIRRFDGGEWSRLAYVYYAASHDDYHRGQLTLYARLLGLVPALTQKIQKAKAG